MEVKPILSTQANISVVVEPPSSEEHDISEADRRENEPNAISTSDVFVSLGERIVEGAEEPNSERRNSACQRGKRRLISPTNHFKCSILVACYQNLI